MFNVPVVPFLYSLKFSFHNFSCDKGGSFEPAKGLPDFTASRTTFEKNFSLCFLTSLKTSCIFGSFLFNTVSNALFITVGSGVFFFVVNATPFFFKEIP